jgi:hypothetical protein
MFYKLGLALRNGKRTSSEPGLGSGIHGDKVAVARDDMLGVVPFHVHGGAVPDVDF